MSDQFFCLKKSKYFENFHCCMQDRILAIKIQPVSDRLYYHNSYYLCIHSFIDKDDDEDDEMEESVTESDSDLEDEYEFNVKKALKLSARGHHPFGSKRGRSSSMEDSSSSKKRKADKPKKQSSTISETIGNS